MTSRRPDLGRATSREATARERFIKAATADATLAQYWRRVWRARARITRRIARAERTQSFPL